MNLISGRRATRLLAAALLSATAALSAPALAHPVSAAPAAHAAAVHFAAPTIHRHEEIERAKAWLTADHGRPVPYTQDRDWNDGYRQDCSGYASMTLGLPKPGPNTVALKNEGWTRPIGMSELNQGDLIIKADSDSSKVRHVVIFDHWVNAGRTEYWAYEQAGGVGTRYTTHDYGLREGDGYHAAHPRNLAD
ncbi:hypothetical protein [Streptomyces sp. NPDC001678]|uniref:hypothetical protein n=1 Tax=Streptomyces sp. NPDC001678 TaxID=3364599 RepID=UPI003697A645